MNTNEDRGDAVIMKTLGVEVFWNAGGNISIEQLHGKALVAFTEDEARLVLEGLASALGYRIVKPEGEDDES